MKALSIQQPWAYLILHRGKDVENREWRRNISGRIWVHAGKKIDLDAYWYFYAQARGNFPSLPDMRKMTGALVGSVEIIGCITRGCRQIQDEGLRPFHDSQWFNGSFGFCLREPQPLETPIPARGQLGFFNIEFGNAG